MTTEGILNRLTTDSYVKISRIEWNQDKVIIKINETNFLKNIILPARDETSYSITLARELFGSVTKPSVSQRSIVRDEK